VSSATPEFSDLDRIGHETAFINELAIWEHCRKPKFVSECDDFLSIRKVRARIAYDDCVCIFRVHRINNASVFRRLHRVIQRRSENGDSNVASSAKQALPLRAILRSSYCQKANSTRGG